MDTIGLDLHERESRICIITEEGTMQPIFTSHGRLSAVIGNRLPARVILETSIGSEWAAEHFESTGHQVSWLNRTTRRCKPLAFAA